MDLPTAFGILLAFIALAITVTPAIQNRLAALTAWTLTALYAGWLYTSRQAEVDGLIQQYPVWTRTGLAIIVATGVVAVWFWLRGRDISINGADSYLFKHVADNRYFVIVGDVTIVNHRHDRAASVGAEFVIIEEVEMAATNDTNGPLETVRHKHVCHPEIEPVPKWEQNQFFKRNKLLEFPLQLAPGETKRGYVAFCVWEKRGPTWAVPENRNSGTLIFTDYSAKRALKRLPKERRLFIDGF